MVYNKYPTTFSTHEEFWKILNSIPWKDRSEWVGNLSIELLRMKDDKGWAVAHKLAEFGAIPKEFLTEELLRVKDEDGWTVADEDPKRPTRQQVVGRLLTMSLQRMGQFQKSF